MFLYFTQSNWLRQIKRQILGNQNAPNSGTKVFQVTSFSTNQQKLIITWPLSVSVLYIFAVSMQRL